MTSSEKETPTDRNFRQNAKCNILGRQTLGYKYTGHAWSQRIVCFLSRILKLEMHCCKVNIHSEYMFKEKIR